MKRLFFALIIGMVLTPVFLLGESNTNTSEVYYVNVPVEKIYPSWSGYVIQYRGSRGYGTVGLPREWFSGTATKAELIVLPRGRSWPSMSIFYKDGEFSHVRLYVHNSKGHQTWGNIPQGTDVSRYFNAETLEIEL